MFGTILQCQKLIVEPTKQDAKKATPIGTHAFSLLNNHSQSQNLFWKTLTIEVTDAEVTVQVTEASFELTPSLDRSAVFEEVKQSTWEDRHVLRTLRQHLVPRVGPIGFQ